MSAKRREPSKIILSPTRIRSWLECQLQYKFTYIDKLSRLYYRANRFDTFGATLHRTLQMFYEAGGAAAVPPESLEKTLEDCWMSAGYADSQEEAQALERGRGMVRAFWEASEREPSRAILIEKQIRLHYPDFVLMGRLDRLDEHPDGTLEVIDYKSGLEDVTEDGVRDSLAMVCYSLLVEKQYPGRRVMASIVSLPACAKATAEFRREELDVFEELAQTVAQQMQGREEFLPDYAPHCESCIYNRRCYKGGAVDWEEKRRLFDQTQEGAW